MQGMPPSQRKRSNFGYTMQSFLGHLQGTQKSLHTVNNYRTDLMCFAKYAWDLGYSADFKVTELAKNDLEKYPQYLLSQGLSTNTRRRKVLTLRKWLRYVESRGRVSKGIEGFGLRFPAPVKIEHAPEVLDLHPILAAVNGPLPSAHANDYIHVRNRALIWLMAETGILVSEIGKVRVSDLQEGTREFSIEIFGRNGSRAIQISRDLGEYLKELARIKRGKYLFTGCNRHGPLGTPMTARGVELVFKEFFNSSSGLPEKVTPRLLRHSVVVKWLNEGVSQEEVKRRMGLLTQYAFKILRPHFSPTKSKT